MFYGALLGLLNTNSPALVGNKIGWWRGDAFNAMSTGDEVTSWTDLTGLGHTLIPTDTSPDRQVVAKNSIASTKHTAHGKIKNGLYYLDGSTLFNLTADWTIFLVIKGCAIGGTEEGMCCFRILLANNPEFRLARNPANGNLYVSKSLTAYASNYNLPPDTYKCLVITHTGGTTTLYVNNSAQTWASTPGAWPSENIRSLVINEGNNTTNYFFSGKTAEAIIFNAALGSGDRTILWDYALARYAIGTIVYTTVTLTYASDGDTNGVFYFMGTVFGQNAGWFNPYPQLLTTSVSALSAGSNLANFTDRVITAFAETTNVANSWIKFDLGANNTLKLQGWTWRASQYVVSNNFDATALKIEGSNDDSSWTQLDARTGMTWTTNGQYRSWTFSDNGVAYRYMKITQTAANDGGTNYIECGDIELYGEFTYGR